MSKQCITIPIIDNLQTENPLESFFVTLERIIGSTPEGVILERNVAEVIVIDNDGKPSVVLIKCSLVYLI